MHCKDLLKETICYLNQPMLEHAKNMLHGELLSYSILNPEDVTADILAEKLCDYFAALEIKVSKPFDKVINTYMNDIDSVVGHHIAKPVNVPTQSGKPDVIVPRSRKYYEKAMAIKKTKISSVTELIDYTRIMMCLYTAALKKEDGVIQNFDYSLDCIIPENLFNALEKEEVTVFRAAKKARFDTKELYSTDSSTLILAVIILCSIINRKVEGDYDYE